MAYLKSLELAKQSENIEGQAESQVGLGEASYGVTKKDEAVGWLKKAQESYVALGDESQVSELEKRIVQIKNPENK